MFKVVMTLTILQRLKVGQIFQIVINVVRAILGGLELPILP
jgi:hypothetical protein